MAANRLPGPEGRVVNSRRARSEARIIKAWGGVNRAKGRLLGAETISSYAVTMLFAEKQDSVVARATEYQGS